MFLLTPPADLLATPNPSLSSLEAFLSIVVPVNGLLSTECACSKYTYVYNICTFAEFFCIWLYKLRSAAARCYHDRQTHLVLVLMRKLCLCYHPATLLHFWQQSISVKSAQAVAFTPVLFQHGFLPAITELIVPQVLLPKFDTVLSFSGACREHRWAICCSMV